MACVLTNPAWTHVKFLLEMSLSSSVPKCGDCSRLLYCPWPFVQNTKIAVKLASKCHVILGPCET